MSATPDVPPIENVPGATSPSLRDSVGTFGGHKRNYLIAVYPRDTHTDPYTDSPAHVWFMGHVSLAVYPATASSTCTATNGAHPTPRDGCTCGFYALKSYESIATAKFAGSSTQFAHGSSGISDVTLYGDILEGPRGFRARSQQITRYRADRYCFTCGRPATCLLPGPGLHPLNARHASPDTYRVLNSACDVCAPTANGSRMSLADASALAQTTIQWGEHMPLEFYIPATVRLPLPDYALDVRLRRYEMYTRLAVSGVAVSLLLFAVWVAHL